MAREDALKRIMKRLDDHEKRLKKLEEDVKEIKEVLGGKIEDVYVKLLEATFRALGFANPDEIGSEWEKFVKEKYGSIMAYIIAQETGLSSEEARKIAEETGLTEVEMSAKE